jgi:hypothetical protein
MAALGRKVKNALDEARILVLGAQVLLGFQYRGFMEPGYERLPSHARAFELAGLGLLLVSLGLLLAPAARHRLVERGADSSSLFGFTMAAICAALVPFSAALALDLFIAGERIQGPSLGAVAAAAGALCMLGLWFAFPLAKRGGKTPDPEIPMASPKLEERIEQVLTEARVVLPGAQAMLGFQLAMMLMDAFEKLSSAARAIHFVSLCLIALATLFLMAPPAFHRLAERGEDTERLERFASAMVLAAMAALAAGLSLELAVVTERWNGSLSLGLTLAAISFGALAGGWFGLPLMLRRLKQGS